MTSQTYYIQFRSTNGTPLYSADGNSWFEVTDPSFSAETPINSSGQLSAGTISFGDLTFDLLGNTALPTIFENLAAGQSIGAVEIADYTDIGTGPTLVSDDIFSTGALTSLSTNGDVTTLSLAYSTLQEEVSVFRDGSFEPPATAQWDSASNMRVPVTSPAADQMQIPEATGGPASLTYFVQFRTANGTILTAANGDSWFAVSDIALSDDKPSTTGKVTFGNLSFTLQNSAVLPTLFLDETQGLRLSQIELAGYSTGGGGPDLVQDDFFGTDILQQNTIGAGGADTLSLAYGALVEQSFSTSNSGIVSMVDENGWNVVTNSAATAPAYARSASLTAEPTVTSPITPGSYYVQFRNAAGQALAGANGDTWFAIQAPDVSTSATPTASFAPLTLQLAAPDIYPALLQDLTSNTDLSAVEIAGYSAGSTPTLAQDDIFQTVSITGITNAGLLTLSYEGLQERAVSSQGSGTIGTTGNFNVANDALAGNVPIDAAATLPATESSPGPLTYFVQLRGAGGTILTGDNGATWFAVDSPTASQDYVGASVAFGTLGLTLESGSDLPKSFLDEATQTPFTQVELAGYSASGYLVEDDLYGTASIIEDTANADGSNSLGLSYQTIVNNSYTRVGATDTLSGTAGWNLATKAADTTPTYAAAAPLSGLPASAYGQTAPEYFVRFVTSGGTTLTAPGGISWFAISDVAFNSDIASAKLQFGNLSFSIGPDAILPSLLTDISSGAVITKVEIAGYAGGGSTPTLVQDDIFETATVNSFSTDATGTVSLGLTFNTLQEQSDSASPATTVGWDNATKSQPATIPITAPALGEPTAQATPGGLTYFVQIKQANGTVLPGNNDSQWFAVTNISDGQTNSLSTNGNPSANLNFGALSFSLPLGSELPTVFLDQATDTEIGQIELAGYSTATDTLVVDDLFDNGYISGTNSNGADGTAGISFSYDELVQQSYTDSGHTAALAETGGWNKATNAAASAPEFAAAAPLDSLPTGVACFLTGTQIATETGPLQVECLAIGMRVLTLHAGLQPIKWIGYRHLDLRTVGAPEMLYPVRICRDAFAPDVPRRDLLVTQDHCLLIDGGLIPARMLVNDRSIILNRGIRQFTVYHVELDRHDILLAENLAAESYLDTGNRGDFANASTAMLRPDFAINQAHQNWVDAAAPLTIDRATVEPIWQRLAARAQNLGFISRAPAPMVTSDPDPHILTQDGAIIRPLRQNGGQYLFMLPPGVTAPRLISRTFRPSETIGPFVDDRRDLGMLVGEITLRQGLSGIPITGHLTEADLPGWFGLDSAAHRWTNGSATLPISAVNTTTILAIQIVHAGPYKIGYNSKDSAMAS